MTEERKLEIIQKLLDIYNNFEPNTQIDPDSGEQIEPLLTMYGLIKRYNATGKNVELIGGQWVIDNCSEPLKSLA